MNYPLDKFEQCLTDAVELLNESRGIRSNALSREMMEAINSEKTKNAGEHYRWWWVGTR